jgi:hypothetical protein
MIATRQVKSDHRCGIFTRHFYSNQSILATMVKFAITYFNKKIAMHLTTSIFALIATAMLLTVQPVVAQKDVKIEREKKVSPGQVPPRAVQWLQDALKQVESPDWYYELSNENESYEAKFKWKGERYSVEFHKDGGIEDIEIQRKWRLLPADVKEQMQSYFDSSYTKHKTTRIQVQYSGDEALMKLLFTAAAPASLTRRFELEYHGKDEEENALWESLFDSEGQHISRRRIIVRPVDNINY